MISWEDTDNFHETFRQGEHQASYYRNNVRNAEERHNKRKQLLDRAFKKISEHWSDKGVELKNEDVQKMLSTKYPETEPSIPIFMLIIAVLQDLMDVALTISIVGKILLWIFLLPVKITIFAILYFYYRDKLGGSWWKKRFIGGILAEITPFDFIPATTILVLMAHYRHKKIVQLMNLGLEVLHKHKLI